LIARNNIEIDDEENNQEKRSRHSSGDSCDTEKLRSFLIDGDKKEESTSFLQINKSTNNLNAVNMTEENASRETEIKKNKPNETVH
jgi:hypothetical protein